MFFDIKALSESTHFPRDFNKGFNVGVSLANGMPLHMQEQTKEILHLMIKKQPKEVSYYAILTGFSFELENIRRKEREEKRKKEIQKINENLQKRESERGR